MFIRNAWYVIAWSHELQDNEDFLSRTLCNEPLVTYRCDNGEVVVLEDRCCHRLAPLSKGRREGDYLRCMYHGLKFDASGVCVEIPGQKKIPPTAKIRTYPAVEHNNWIWVWMGAPEAADISLLPDTNSLDKEDWHYKPNYLHWDIDYRLGIDNLLDFSHLSYVHETTLGGTARIAQVSPTIEALPRGLRVSWWLLNIEPPPFHTQFKEFGGKVDRWFKYDFLVPGVLIMWAGSQKAGTGAPEGNIRDCVETRSCQALMPESEETSHYFFANPHNIPGDKEAITEQINTSVYQAFAEDYDIITAQQEVIARSPGYKMVPIAADEALSKMRRLMQRMLRDENNASAENDAELTAVVQ